MDRRQDAYKAFSKIKSQSKILNSNQVKITWAPGKGIKNKEYKDYWESDIGCSFIPHKILLEQQDDIDLDLLEEGGMVDEDSIPDRLKELRRLKRQEKKEKELLLKQQQQQIQAAAAAVAATSTNAAAVIAGTVAVNPLIPFPATGYVAAPPPPPPIPPPLPLMTPPTSTSFKTNPPSLPPLPPPLPLMTPPTSTSFQTNLPHPVPVSLNHSIPMPVPPPPPPMPGTL